MLKTALTVAGSDPSGGAGLQADLKTFHTAGVYGMSVVTLLTAQNTQGVRRVVVTDPQMVRDQLDAVLNDIRPDAAKTGALGSEAVIMTVAEFMKKTDFPWIVDPVMISKNGESLMDEGALEAFRKNILPRAALLMPNLFEAEKLTGLTLLDDQSIENAAREICKMGAEACVIKGGHRESDANDLYYSPEESFWIKAERIQTKNTHGTGCTYSAAVTALTAQGKGLTDAVRLGKKFVTQAIRDNPGIGKGHGPLNHCIPL